MKKRISRTKAATARKTTVTVDLPESLNRKLAAMARQNKCSEDEFVERCISMEHERRKAGQQTVALPLPASLVRRLQEGAKKTGMTEGQLVHACVNHYAGKRVLNEEMYARVMKHAHDETATLDDVLDSVLSIRERQIAYHESGELLKKGLEKMEVAYSFGGGPVHIPSVEAIGFQDGKLVFSDGTNFEPITLADAMAWLAKMHDYQTHFALEQGGGLVAEAQFVKLVADEVIKAEILTSNHTPKPNTRHAVADEVGKVGAR